MGCLSCIAYFSHDSCNIADIITSIPSSAYINAKNVTLFVAIYSLWHSCCIQACTWLFTAIVYLNELKLDQYYCITTNNIVCGTQICGSISNKTPTTCTITPLTETTIRGTMINFCIDICRGDN